MSDLSPFILPTDLNILKILTNGQRQTPINVASILDMDRTYMSERLRYLENQGILHDAPPADRSGMYELTNLGRIAVWHARAYVRDSHAVFMTTCRLIQSRQPDDQDLMPDLVVLNDDLREGLSELKAADGLVIPSEFELERDIGERPVPKLLYSLHLHGLAERKDGMDVYRINARGERAAELCNDQDPSHIELTEELRTIYTDRENWLLEGLTSPCPPFRFNDAPDIRDLP